jgi:putative PIN family toxin of toxin-antitoxin system
VRALLDAKIYISYLLSPARDSPPIAIVEAAFTGAYTVVIPAGVIAELRDKIATKAYLAARITQPQAERLVELLNAVAETLPEIKESLPEVGRDRKDDYLYAHALIGRADYLVSDDKDVRDILRIGDVQIISPTEFFQILQQAGLVQGE